MNTEPIDPKLQELLDRRKHEDRERQRRYHKRRKERDPEGVRKYFRKWRLEHKEEQDAYNRQYNKEHPGPVKAASKRAKVKYWAAWKAYKSTLKCVRCGENHPACLDFHHRDPTQKKDISQMVRNGTSLDLIKVEIAKCDVLCKNCHTKLHAEEI